MKNIRLLESAQQHSLRSREMLALIKQTGVENLSQSERNSLTILAKELGDAIGTRKSYKQKQARSGGKPTELILNSFASQNKKTMLARKKLKK